MVERDVRPGRDSSAGSDDTLGELIRRAGRPEPPPEAVERKVYQAVRAEWLRSTPVRRFPAIDRRMAIAASLAAIALVVWFGQFMPEPLPSATVAEIDLVRGDLWVEHGDSQATPLTAQTTLVAGDRVRSGASGSAALHLPSGISLRLDAASAFILTGGDQIKLESGSLYVDAGQGISQDPGITVLTPYGEVRHLGTQFLIGLSDRGLRIRVREGVVAFDGDTTITGEAGQSLVVDLAGSVTRIASPTYGPDWRWVDELVPSFKIDDRSLEEFLLWAARETGRELVFEDVRAEAEARTVILKGSIDGFTPSEALRLVLPTTDFTHTEQDAILRVSYGTSG